jgi:hypothetical protein
LICIEGCETLSELLTLMTGSWHNAQQAAVRSSVCHRASRTRHGGAWSEKNAAVQVDFTCDVCNQSSFPSTSVAHRSGIILYNGTDPHESAAVNNQVQPGDAAASTTKTETLDWKRKIVALQAELVECREQIEVMRKTDRQLRDRFCDQVRQQFQKDCNNRFEDINVDYSSRSTTLISRYNDVFNDDRQVVLDALDQLPGISSSDDELKEKLLFSIIVLCFRTVDQSLLKLKDDTRRLLEPRGEEVVGSEPTRPGVRGEVRGTKMNNYNNTDLGGDISLQSTAERLLINVDSAVLLYVRKTAQLRDVTADVKAVCDQLWTTLYDYPSLKDCPELHQFVTTCLRLAWCLTVQNPPYSIRYDCVGQTFDAHRHSRFHTSNAGSSKVQNVIWPGLVEANTGVYVCKAIVVT